MQKKLKERINKKNKYLHCVIFIFLVASVISGCVSKDLEKMERMARKDVHLEGKNIGGMKESEILENLRASSVNFDEEAVDAVFDEATWEVHPEKEGKKLDVERTLSAIMNAGEGEDIRFVVQSQLPKITSDMFNKNIIEIGSYTTPLLDRSDSRVNNIDLASEKINGFKLAPGEEFSFNKVVGRRTEAKGYEEAPIIIRTEDGPKKGTGVGGGICQLSSTMYNAVEEGGLEVTERHMHSKNVGYVPKGEDATVAYGKVDFKFRNSKSHPIMIVVHLSERSLTVKIIENRNK
jgi:vancomycin resistance protein YoaR